MFLLAKFYQILGDDDKSLKLYESAINTEKKVFLAFNMTYNNINEEHLSQSYEKSINNCLLESSILYAKLRNFQKSIEYGETLLKRDLFNINKLDVHINLALSNILEGNYEKVESLVNKVLLLDPNEKTALFLKDCLNRIRNSEINKEMLYNYFF